MFQEEYKKAYDHILPKDDSMERIRVRAKEKRRPEKTREPERIRRLGKNHAFRPAFAAVFILCALSVTSLPVLAAHVPAVYRILENCSTAIADFVVPEEAQSVSQGIIMQLEAVSVEDNHAEILVSFRDGVESRRINGKTDMFGSYGLYSYDAVSNIAGCSFLEYDETEGKAYFKVDITAENSFDRNKLSFYTHELLTGLGTEERDIDLSAVRKEAPLKSVTISGRSGDSDALAGFFVAGTAEDPRLGALVLDTMDAELCAEDDFTITGMAFMEGVLRVQICMGDNTHADRHVQLFLTDKEGNEKYEDCSVSWREEVGETKLTFYEFWFLEDLEETAGILESREMYGLFHDTGESIEGDWKVTFRLEE